MRNQIPPEESRKRSSYLNTYTSVYINPEPPIQQPSMYYEDYEHGEKQNIDQNYNKENFKNIEEEVSQKETEDIINHNHNKNENSSGDFNKLNEKEIKEREKRNKRRRERMEPSYSLAAQLTHPLFQYYCDLLIILQSFGIATAYLIVVGDLMPEVFEDFSGDSEDDEWYEGRRAWITFSVMGLLPLCLAMKRLDMLRFTSFLALFTVVYIVICCVAYYFDHFNDLKDVDYKLFNFSLDIFSALPIVVFSFGCHINILPLYNELQNPSVERINNVIKLSLGGAFLTYLCIGLFAYLTYGGNTDSDVLTNYPTKTEFSIAKIGLSILVILSFPLQAFPFRLSLHNLLCLWLEGPTILSKRSCNSEEITQNEKSWKDWFDKDGEVVRILEMIFVVGSSYCVALFVEDLGIVFAIVGATASPSLSYILPGIFYMKLKRSTFSEDRMRVSSLFLIIWGVFISVMGNVITSGCFMDMI